MDGGPISPGAWQSLKDGALGASLLAFLLAVARLVLNRKRPAADVELVRAQAHEAEARAAATGADSTLKLLQEVYALNMREIERLNKKIADVEAERERERDVVRLAREIVRSDAEREQLGEGTKA